MKTNQQIALEVIQGKWGNGNERKQKLTKAGYNYQNVQTIVNSLMKGDTSALQEKTPDGSPIVILGKETLNVTVNLNRYNSINLLFTVDETSDEIDTLLEGWD